VNLLKLRKLEAFISLIDIMKKDGINHKFISTQVKLKPWK